MSDDNDYIELNCVYTDEPLFQHCQVCGCGLWIVKDDIIHEPLCFRCISWLATILLNSALPSQNRLNRLERIEQMTHDRVDRLDQRLVQHEAGTPKFADRIYELRTELRRWTNQRIGNLVGQLRNLDSRLWNLRTFPNTCYECHKPYRATLRTPDAPDGALCEWDGFEWQPVEETGS